MKKIMPLVFAAALAVTPVIVGPTSAHAGDGANATEVAGGLLGGMLSGGALAQPHYYAPPRRRPFITKPSPYMRAIVIGLAVNPIGTIGAGDGIGHASEFVNRPQEAEEFAPGLLQIRT